MISLGRKDFPARKGELADALDDALHRFVEKPGLIVDLRSRVFPYVDEIAINLDNAILDSSPHPWPRPKAKLRSLSKRPSSVSAAASWPCQGFRSMSGWKSETWSLIKDSMRTATPF